MGAVVQKMEPELLFSFTWHPYFVDPNVDYSEETPTLVRIQAGIDQERHTTSAHGAGFDKIPSNRRLEAFRMNDGGWTEQMQNIGSYVAQRA
jgi:hypothetical protein